MGLLKFLQRGFELPKTVFIDAKEENFCEIHKLLEKIETRIDTSVKPCEYECLKIKNRTVQVKIDNKWWIVLLTKHYKSYTLEKTYFNKYEVKFPAYNFSLREANPEAGDFKDNDYLYIHEDYAMSKNLNWGITHKEYIADPELLGKNIYQVETNTTYDWDADRVLKMLDCVFLALATPYLKDPLKDAEYRATNIALNKDLYNKLEGKEDAQ